MTEATTDALQQMARHVAERLVADALKGMMAQPVTVTIHPQPAPRRMLEPGTSPSVSSPTPAAKRRGRKPGRKPKGRKAWTPAQHAKFAATMAARRKPARAVPAAAPVKRGPGRPRKVEEPPNCVRCDHDESAHCGENGKCLSARCSCAGFCR